MTRTVVGLPAPASHRNEKRPCFSRPRGSVPIALSDYTAMDEALAFLAPYGPDLRNGLTSHAPMAAEALVAMGRPDAVVPWLEGYRDGLLPRRPARDRIAPDGWRGALGHEELFPEWLAFFERELDDGSWSDVLAVWTARL